MPLDGQWRYSPICVNPLELEKEISNEGGDVEMDIETIIYHVVNTFLNIARTVYVVVSTKRRNENNRPYPTKD